MRELKDDAKSWLDYNTWRKSIKILSYDLSLSTEAPKALRVISTDLTLHIHAVFSEKSDKIIHP